MARRLRTTVSIVPSQLKPAVPDYTKLKAKDELIKERQKRNFDHHRGVRELDPLITGNKVWITDLKTYRNVKSNPQTRSYVISTPTGQVRRNRRSLTKVPENTQQSSAGEKVVIDSNSDKESLPETQVADTNTDSKNLSLSPSKNTDSTENLTTTRCGRVVKPPKRYSE